MFIAHWSQSNSSGSGLFLSWIRVSVFDADLIFGFLQLALSSGYIWRVSTVSLGSILNRSVNSIVASSRFSLFVIRLICEDSQFESLDQFVPLVTVLV